nr:hypothetical protein GCM10025732_52200 [Glycomyces mayteni]
MGSGEAGFREVFASGEFRVLWLAQAQSRIGDQLARVALALLVFDRTSSAAMTALVYALTFLPPLLTAPLLAGLADRYSRRSVMVAVDLLRAVLIGLMAVPQMPLAALMVLVTLATCPQPLFSAARNATLPQVLPDGRFAVGMSVITATDGLAQIAGFTVGGLLVAATGNPHLVLAANAATFALSAALLRWGIGPHRPEPDGEDGDRARPGASRWPASGTSCTTGRSSGSPPSCGYSDASWSPKRSPSPMRPRSALATKPSASSWPAT